MTDREALVWATSILQQAQQKRTFGEVVFKMEGGKIVHAQEKKNFKPPTRKD